MQNECQKTPINCTHTETFPQQGARDLILNCREMGMCLVAFMCRIKDANTSQETSISVKQQPQESKI